MTGPAGEAVWEGGAMVGPARVWGWGAPLAGECHGDGCNVFIISSPLLLEITRVSVSWGRSLPPRQRGKCLFITMATTIPTSLAVLQLLLVLLLLVLLLLLLQPFWSQVNLSTISISLIAFLLTTPFIFPLFSYTRKLNFDVQCFGASELLNKRKEKKRLQFFRQVNGYRLFPGLVMRASGDLSTPAAGGEASPSVHIAEACRVSIYQYYIEECAVLHWC